MRNIDFLLEHQRQVNQYLSLKEHQISAYHFSSIFLWQDFFDFEFQKINDALCIFAHSPKSAFMYLPPLGKNITQATLENCFNQMKKINPRTARIENLEADDLETWGRDYRNYVKSQEYVYLKENLIELKGGDYKSQRHDIHHLLNHHKPLFRQFDITDISACLSLYEQWANVRKLKHPEPVYLQMLEENKIVHELAMQYQDALGLSGFVVEIDKKIKAYSLGYMLNSKTFCVLLEITDVKLTGLASYIYNQVCKSQEVIKATLINSMDDFGMPFVAASKQAYHPSFKPVSYTITED